MFMERAQDEKSRQPRHLDEPLTQDEQPRQVMRADRPDFTGCLWNVYQQAGFARFFPIFRPARR